MIRKAIQTLLLWCSVICLIVYESNNTVKLQYYRKYALTIYKALRNPMAFIKWHDNALAEIKRLEEALYGKEAGMPWVF